MTGIAAGYLHTSGNQIVDSSGANVRLTGVNWFGGEGFAFVPNGLHVRNYKDMMRQMADLGFNTIRLPWSDAMLEPGRSPDGGIDYRLNPDLYGLTSLEVFDRIIAEAGRLGLRVILDHHRSGDGASANENGLWYTDQYPESVMIGNWRMLAQRYAGNPTVVGADLHNEPHNPATWGDGNPATDWAAAAERIGNAIQAVNGDWLLIVEGIETYRGQWDWWGGNLRGAKERPVVFGTPGKLVYSVHSYGPSVYQMPWFGASDFPNNMPGLYTDSWGWLIRDNLAPVLVGELGGHLTTQLDRTYMAKLTQYMNGDLDGNGTLDLGAGKQGASWTYWSWNPTSHDTGGILTSDWTTVDDIKYQAIRGALFDTSLPSSPPPSDSGGSPTGGYQPEPPAGEDSAETIASGLGNDTVTAGGGADIVYGNQGSDLLYGNQGSDALYGGQGGDTLFGGQADDAVYGNRDDDRVYGNLGDDRLFGGQGNDWLHGGQGADRLSGNLGDDTLSGGAGADLFVFGGAFGRDRIEDFDGEAGDRLVLPSDRGFTVLAVADGVALDFGGGNRLTLATLRLDSLPAGWILSG